MLVEGAGSAAEINLREGDIANMGFARAAGCPVVLIGDIDRGGVFAQILGTKAALAPDDAATIVGFIVNKFRGDASLFAERHGDASPSAPAGAPSASRRSFPTRRACRRRTPSASPASSRARKRRSRSPCRCSPASPISTISIRCRLEPGVRLVFVRAGRAAAGLPISSSCPAARRPSPTSPIFRAQGWDIDLFAHVRRGGRVLGVCGGYQMLGTRVADPDGIEGPAGAVEGLGLLDVETVAHRREDASNGSRANASLNGAPFAGYEMHVGRTDGPDCARPLLRFADGRADGAVSADGRVAGAYVHGLFADDRQRAAWLASLGAASELAYEATVERTLDALADHLGAHLDLDAMLSAAR